LGRERKSKLRHSRKSSWFFKALKQNLRLKTFVGTWENALQTRIWTALIAHVTALIAHVADQVPTTASEFRLVAVEPGGPAAPSNCLCTGICWAWIDNPFQPPPAITPALEQFAVRLT
jgi:hypothetical protein